MLSYDSVLFFNVGPIVPPSNFSFVSFSLPGEPVMR